MNEFDKFLKDELERIKAMPYGDERTAAIKDYEELLKIRTEERTWESEQKNKKCERKHQIIDWFVKIGIVALQVGVPAYVFGKYVRAGFEFEKEGTYTYKTFSNVLSKFRPF